MKDLSYDVQELDTFRFETDLIDDVVKYHSKGTKCLLHGKSYSHFFDSNIGFDDYKIKIATAIDGISNCGFYCDLQDLISQEINNVKESVACLRLAKRPTIRIGKLISRDEIILEFLNTLDDQITVLSGGYGNFRSKRIKVPSGLDTILIPFLKLLSFDFEIINSEATFHYTGLENDVYELYGELNTFYIKSTLDEFKGILGHGPYYGPIIWLGSDGSSSANELLYFIMQFSEFGLIAVKRDKNGKIRPNYNLIKRCFIKNDLSEFNENFKSLKQQLDKILESKRQAIDDLLSSYK